MSGSWKALPGGSDVSLQTGNTYALVASVSASTTKAKIDQALAKYFPGVKVLSYVEQGESGGPLADPDTDRKQVAAIVRDDTFQGSLSWSKGFPIVAPNLYTLSGAWVLEGSPVPDEAPWAGALPIRRAGAWNPWGVVASAVVVVAVGTVAVYHWRKEIALAIARSS